MKLFRRNGINEAANDAAAVEVNNLREAELTWESSRLSMVLTSEAKAWNIVKLLSGIIFGLVVALCCLMPLKSVEPFVIQTEKSTGLSTVLHIANQRDIPVSEVMNKYWISQYVLARETYDWNTIDQDFYKVRELSMPNIFEPYASQYDVNNKESLDKKLKDNYRIIVKLNSVVINNKETATVRFARQTIDTNSNTTTNSTTWTATIGFEYFPDFDVPEEKRLINPFGFKVTSYRVDEEFNHE